jgi:3-hydroxyisobutyrate dehydrogenase
MATIGFVGLGNMGGPMAANLVKAGHVVNGFDLSQAAKDHLKEAGGTPVETLAEVASGADVIVTMLPAGAHVRKVYTGEDGLFAHARAGTLMIDSSTIDVESARAVASAAEVAGMAMVDAPVSGGVTGAPARSPSWSAGPTRPSPPPGPISTSWARRLSMRAGRATARLPRSATTCCSASR